MRGNRVLIAGKTGDVYLLDAARLGGIGGQLDRLPGCHAYGGMAWDAAARAAFLPCEEGVRRIEVRTSSLAAGWRAAGISGSPVIGGGAVWTLDTDAGVLYALDERTGRRIVHASVGPVTRFASPVLTGSLAVVGTTSGVVALHIQG